jgi:hypothetical protein
MTGTNAEGPIRSGEGYGYTARGQMRSASLSDSRVRLRTRTGTSFRTRGRVGMVPDARETGRDVDDHSARLSSGGREMGARFGAQLRACVRHAGRRSPWRPLNPFQRRRSVVGHRLPLWPPARVQGVAVMCERSPQAIAIGMERLLAEEGRGSPHRHG